MEDTRDTGEGDTVSTSSYEFSARLRATLDTVVARICPGWLTAQRDDIVQAAVLKTLQALRRGEGSASLGTSYLWRVAYCATVDEIRRQRRRREVGIDEPALQRPATEPRANPEQRGMAREIARGIRDCLRRLSEPRRLAVTLQLQGHSVSETARLLGWNPKRAENLVYRGLRELRRCLIAKGLTP